MKVEFFALSCGAAAVAYLTVGGLLGIVPRLYRCFGGRWRRLAGRAAGSRLADISLPLSWLWNRENPSPAEVNTGLEELAVELAFHLRAGEGPVRALRSASRTTGGPIGAVLDEVLPRYESGASLNEMLQRFAQQLDCAEAQFVVNVVRVGVRSGGDLPAMLTGCARVLRERRVLESEVSVQTSEARLSAAIVAGSPVLLCGFLVLFQPEFFEPLYSVSWGWYAIVYAATSWVLGVALVLRLSSSIQAGMSAAAEGEGSADDC